MSGSPPPELLITWTGQRQSGVDGPVHMQIDCRDQRAAERVLRAVNAFDALLVVARACAKDTGGNLSRATISKALLALDAAHPDWRQW